MNWKEQFDEKFSDEWWTAFSTSQDINKLGIESLKDFIQSLLDQQKKEIVEIVNDYECRIGNPVEDIIIEINSLK